MTAEAELLKQETGEAFLVLLTIDHDDLTAPIRVVNNHENITSNGNEFIAFPFEIELPGAGGDSLPEVTLRIDNVDRQIVQAIRSISGPPTVTLEVIMASTPNTIEAGPYEFTLRDATYDALTVEGRLQFQDILNEPYPADSFGPSGFQGLFG